jgi:hypothetical protein
MIVAFVPARRIPVMAQCDRADVCLFFVNRGRASGHRSGDYGF